MNDAQIGVSDAEKEFRQKLFNNDYGNLVSNSAIFCTVCATNLNWMVTAKKVVLKHPILEVCLCEGCLDSQSNTDRIGVCFWCTKIPDNFVYCSCCPYLFCHDCIKVNFGAYGLCKIQLKNNWKCLLCKSKQIWTQRAICEAAELYINSDRTVSLVILDI